MERPRPHHWRRPANFLQERPKNVLLLIADDLGCFLPSYGDRNAVMPNIERLAQEGVRFSNAFCTSPSCSASRSVVLSGLYNHATGHYGHRTVNTISVIFQRCSHSRAC